MARDLPCNGGLYTHSIEGISLEVVALLSSGGHSLDGLFLVFIAVAVVIVLSIVLSLALSVVSIFLLSVLSIFLFTLCTYSLLSSSSFALCT